MGLRCLVKVDGVSDLSVARYAAGMGVAYLGIPLKSVDLESFAEIAEWVCGVDWVGECANHKNDLNATLQRYALHAVELSPKEAALYAPLPANLRLFLRCPVLDALSFDRLPPATHYILEGHVKAYKQHKKAIQALCQHHSVLLAWHDKTHSLEEALDWGIKGFALKGQAEERPGWSNYDALAEQLEQLEIDN